MWYKNLDVKFHFWDRVIYQNESYIVVSYDSKDWNYRIYKDWERKYNYTDLNNDWKFWHYNDVSERVLKRDFQWELKEEFEVLDMSRDIIKAHKELLDKINTNKKWYHKVFSK